MAEQDTAEPSSATLSESPVSAAAPSFEGAADAPVPAGNFGTTRGSGLARGKRQAQSAASAASPAVPADYKPTSIEVITTQSEYRNPFTGEVSVGSNPASAPAQPERTESNVATAALKSQTPLARPGTPIVSDETSSDEDATPGLTILPPAEPQRVQESWEPPSDITATAKEEKPSEPAPAPAPAAKVEERPAFRPERRNVEHRPREHRGPDHRDSRHRERHGGREHHGSSRHEHPRDSHPRHSPGEKSQPKPAGLLAWIKNLFTGGSESVTNGNAKAHEAGRSNEHQHGGHRRRRRGRGRGGFAPNGRDGGSPEASHHREGGSSSGGPRRRRRRGGRGRHHGGGSGSPRSEGTQGGGVV